MRSTTKNRGTGKGINEGKLGGIKKVRKGIRRVRMGLGSVRGVRGVRGVLGRRLGRGVRGMLSKYQYNQ